MKLKTFRKPIICRLFADEFYDDMASHLQEVKKTKPCENGEWERGEVTCDGCEFSLAPHCLASMLIRDFEK